MEFVKYTLGILQFTATFYLNLKEDKTLSVVDQWCEFFKVR